MAITLTCACGQEQAVANTSEGKIACRACGKALTIPPMGVLATAKTKPAMKPIESASSRRLGLLLIGAALVLMLVTGIGVVAWAMTREQPVEPTPIVQNDPPAPEKTKRTERPSRERHKTEPEKKDPPRVIEPAPAEKTNPPKDVIEPIKPIKKATPVIEPVGQFGELPNPFLLKPIGPEPAPKVVDKKPPNVIEPVTLVWKLKGEEVFYQELVVLQKPTFKVPPGIVVQSLLQYRIVSRFTVKKVEKDGSLVVEQKIESANLLQADDLTKGAVAGAVTQMKGTTYTLHLNPKMEVTKFEGAVAGPKVVQVAGGMGMQMTSLLDRDGWKELAQATFFQMDKPLKVKDRWSKPMNHNWGALGTWSGNIHYLYFGKQDNFHKVGYGLQLNYKAPGASAVGMLKITGATFQPPQAEGMLLFDAAKGKVVAAEERFRVRGVIQANLLGQNTQIEVEEDQHFLIRIHDKMPK